MAEYIPVLTRLVQTDTCKTNPLNIADAIIMQEFYPSVAAGNLMLVACSGINYMLVLKAGATKHGLTTQMGRRCFIQAFGWIGLCFDSMVGCTIRRDPAFDPSEWFGERGCLIDEVYNVYNYDADHINMSQAFSCDLIIATPGHSILPLLFFWGETERAYNIFKVIWGHIQVDVNEVIASGRGENMKNQTLLWFFQTVPQALCYMGKPEVTFEILREYFVSYENIAEGVTTLAMGTPMIQVRSKMVTGSWYCLESMIDHIKMVWLCCCPAGSVSASVAFAGLDDPEEMFLQTHTTSPITSQTFAWIYFTEMASILWAALAHERYGKLEKALEYAAMVERPYWKNLEDPEGLDAPTTVTHQVALAKACRGRPVYLFCKCRVQQYLQPLVAFTYNTDGVWCLNQVLSRQCCDCLETVHTLLVSIVCACAQNVVECL